MRNFLLGILCTVIVLAVAAWLSLKQGYIDFAADHPPSLLETKFAMAAVDASTEKRAPRSSDPVAPTDDNIAAGAKLYLDHCAGCHGIPSNPDSQFSRSFYPAVPAFFKDSPDMPEAQNFYIVQHGIRWTGMPAWGQTLSDDQIWQVVLFLSNIEKLPPAAQKLFGNSTEGAPMPQGMHMSQ